MRSLPTRYIVVRPAGPDLVAAFSCEPTSIADIESAAVTALGWTAGRLDTSIRSVWTERDQPCVLAIPEHVERYDEADEFSIRRAGILDDIPAYACLGVIRAVEMAS